MRSLQRVLAVGAVLWVAAGSAFAVDLLLRPRVFNDVPSAELNMSAAGSTASINEINVSAPTGWANRDDLLFSENGSTPASFDTTDAFTFLADVTLHADPIAPRKEAGLRILNPVTGDALFIVNSDGHEIVGFGGGMPFFNAVGAGATPYNAGETVTLGLSYYQQGGVNGVVYTVVQNGNTFSSGFRPWENNEQGVGLGTNLGLYFQINNDPNNPTNSGGVTFSNIRYGRGRVADLIDSTPNAIPEPGTLALLGASLLPLVGLRRRK